MDNRKYGTFPVSDRYRPLLLDPSRDAQVKVCRYMVILGRVQQGEVDPRLSTIPQVVFRPDRILVHAELPSLTRLWWAWLFWWFAYPVVRKTYTVVGEYEDGEPYENGIDSDERDEVSEDERLVTHYKINWRYPARSYHARREYREQGRALGHSPMVSLKIGGQEIPCLPVALVGCPISLHVLTTPGGIGPTFVMPAEIVAEFKGVAACSFRVSVSGYARGLQITTQSIFDR